MTCGSCGRENDADALFCSACGAQLDPRRSDVETRKVVTVVFTDVVGSTALGGTTRSRDAAACDVALLRHDAGDARAARRDRREVHRRRRGGDIRRACLARRRRASGGAGGDRDAGGSRAAQRESRARVRRSARHPHRHQHGRGDRGRRSLGSEARDGRCGQRRCAAGAGRARQGEVLLGQATRLLVGDAVLVEDQRAVAAKGKSQPLAAWRLLGLRPDVPAFAEPVRRRSSVVSKSSRSSARLRRRSARVVVPTRDDCRAARNRQVPPHAGTRTLTRERGARRRRPLRRLRRRHHVPPARRRRPRRRRGRP